MVAITAFALFLRKVVLSHMDGLRIRIESGDSGAATDFRHIHIVGMMINVIQLVAHGTNSLPPLIWSPASAFIGHLPW